MVQPKKYRAKDLKGRTVVGWFAMTHIPHFDREGNKLEGYDEAPMIFNDEPGNRQSGGYWHKIQMDTLEEVNE